MHIHFTITTKIHEHELNNLFKTNAYNKCCTNKVKTNESLRKK